MKRTKVRIIGDAIIEFLREKFPTLTKDDSRKVFSNLYRRFWTKKDGKYISDSE